MQCTAPTLPLGPPVIRWITFPAANLRPCPAIFAGLTRTPSANTAARPCCWLLLQADLGELSALFSRRSLQQRHLHIHQQGGGLSHGLAALLCHRGLL
jgi:hypothetical protein